MILLEQSPLFMCVRTTLLCHTRLCWLTSKDLVTTYNGSACFSLVQGHGGIGIVKFLTGKGFFVTGATFFLAKVLVEKLLRTEPDISKIYVLIKANSQEVALERLKNEKEPVYLNELNTNSKGYGVRVRVIEKKRSKESPQKKITYQSLLLQDDKGNKMKATLFGDQVEGYKDVLAYNGEYEIANAIIRPIDLRLLKDV